MRRAPLLAAALGVLLVACGKSTSGEAPDAVPTETITSGESQSCGFVAFTYVPAGAGEVTYLASASSDCADSTTIAGSWAVTLTSVTPYAGSAGAPGRDYVAHGTFSATLPPSNGGAGTVAVSLEF
jgi:hypothetical protein